MIFYAALRIEYRGKTYSGRYSVEDGVLYVDTAHGKGRNEKAPRDPDKVPLRAAALLRQIVLERHK